MSTPTASPTLSEARDRYVRWLREARDLSEHTVRAYHADASALVRALDERTMVAELDPSVVFWFFEMQRKSGMRSTSLRRRAAGVRSFCGFLYDQQLLTTTPWPAEGLQFQRTRTLPRAVASRDLQRLVRHLIHQADLCEVVCDEPLTRPFAATTLLGTCLMLSTGLRVGELVSFRTCDLDMSGRTVQVMGKGRRERIVYITDDWIARLVSAYALTRDQLSVDHDRFLFNASRAPLSAASMRARLAQAARDAGLDQPVTPHMLRHSAATQLIEAGVNIRFVQRLLGHASLTTTEIYTHVTDQALQRAVAGAGVLSRSLGVDN